MLWGCLALAGLALLGRPEAAWPAGLTGAAGPTGGLYYQYMAGLAKIVYDQYPEVAINLVPGGAAANLVRISRDPAVFGTTTFHQAVQAIKGSDDFEGKPPITNLRVLLSVQDLVYFFPLFLPDVPVQSIEEVRAKKAKLRVATTPRGTVTEWTWRKLLEYSGISYKEIEAWGGKVSFTNFSDMVNLMKDGHVDVMLGAGAGKSGWLVDLTNSRTVKFLPLPDAAVERFAKEYGGAMLRDLPANSYKGQDKAFRTMVTFPTTLIVANESLSAEAAYKIVKAVCDNVEKFRLVHAEQLGGFSPAQAWQAGAIPVHPGAAKYFREKGYMK
jgi:TRAP transporter TAXI family solute receptor